MYDVTKNHVVPLVFQVYIALYQVRFRLTSCQTYKYPCQTYKKTCLHPKNVCQQHIFSFSVFSVAIAVESTSWKKCLHQLFHVWHSKYYVVHATFHVDLMSTRFFRRSTLFLCMYDIFFVHVDTQNVTSYSCQCDRTQINVTYLKYGSLTPSTCGTEEVLVY